MGTFLFYTQLVDSMMLTALSAIATEQAAPMTTMMKCTKQCLNHCYLNEPKVRSRLGGAFLPMEQHYFSAKQLHSP